jgi:Leucine-rich repeat (LRR) protein
MLNLSDNFIKKLPQNFENLQQLSKLYLDHNELMEIPPELGKITSLKVNIIVSILSIKSHHIEGIEYTIQSTDRLA